MSGGGGDGVLSFTVWPTHAGAVNSKGEEPMFGLEYQRGQITWEMNEQGTLCGRATILVPAGEWAWIIYAHNAYRPGYISARKLSHPLVLAEPGSIELAEITEDEIHPLTPDLVLHD